MIQPPAWHAEIVALYVKACDDRYEVEKDRDRFAPGEYERFTERVRTITECAWIAGVVLPATIA